MGGAASIDPSGYNQMDYEALKASGVDFSVAYKVIHSKIIKGKSTNTLNDVSINFLAIRQLSQNLKNQEHLEKSRKKVLKSRSLPNNLKYKQKQFDNDDSDYSINNADNVVTDDLNADDLAIVTDHEYTNLPSSSFPTSESIPILNTVAKKVTKKPNLFLSVGSDDSIKTTHLERDENKAERASELTTISSNENNKILSPSNHTRLSPHGTLHMGKWKIKENGIFLSESIRGPDGFHFDDDFNTQANSTNRVNPPALGGKNDFIVVATLGSGASGVVSEAIHVPTLTLVALKMLPVYNQQKRQHVSRELAVLYKNLADLRLVDDRLSSENNPKRSLLDSHNHCPNVLSLYNAFVDPKSGMINLVIEYMDGGSLEDLVKQGGCRDERVLADIACQTCKGLSFLHAHKSVHRDIKPANILCSSNGVIKIADFGISKALDKTSGFANSFIGTVCYMSPERIVGETYSFPCDVWSLGLTLLAVAKGRFPLSGSEEDTLMSGAKVENATDWDSPSVTPSRNNAPIGGAGGYWAMIKAICDEEPPTPGPDFTQNFNDFISSCLEKDASDRLTANKLLHLPFITQNVDCPEISDSEKSSSLNVENGHGVHTMIQPVGGKSTSHVDNNYTLHGRLSASSLNEGLPPSSPMTARNATAAVVRRVSRDFSPSGGGGGDFHGRGLECKSSDPIDEETFPYSVRDSIMEEPPDKATDSSKYDYNQSDDTIINAIRLEHLDRVLDKIARKLQLQQSTALSGPGSPDPFVDADDEAEDDADGGFLDFDLQRGSTVAEVANSSLDSIDKLLFKETSTDTPEAKNGKDVYFPSSADGGRSFSSGHSILKSTSSYRHDNNDEIGRINSSEIAPRHIHLRDTHKNTDYMYHADDKNTSFAPSASKNKHVDSYSSSSRSVHFSESGGDGILGKVGVGTNVKNLRSRLNMKALELDVIDDELEAVEGDSSAIPSLPKSSSYFISSKGASVKEDGDQEKSPIHTAAVLIDYCRMLPKLNSNGVSKWRSLASQLHLPLNLVKIAAKSKLGSLVELWDEGDSDEIGREET